MTKQRLNFYNIILGLLLLIWPYCTFGSIATLDNPGGGNRFILLSTAWAIWSYPVIYLISLIGSRLLFRKNRIRAAAFFAQLPAINILWFFATIPLQYVIDFFGFPLVALLPNAIQESEQNLDGCIFAARLNQNNSVGKRRIYGSRRTKRKA